MQNQSNKELDNGKKSVGLIGPVPVRPDIPVVPIVIITPLIIPNNRPFITNTGNNFNNMISGFIEG